VSVTGCSVHNRFEDIKVFELGVTQELSFGKGCVEVILDNKDIVHGNFDLFCLPPKAQRLNWKSTDHAAVVLQRRELDKQRYIEVDTELGKWTLCEIERLVLTNNLVNAGTFKRIGLFRVREYL
jgi:hypothetical protein